MELISLLLSAIAALTGLFCAYLSHMKYSLEKPAISSIKLATTSDGHSGLVLEFSYGAFPVVLKSIRIAGHKLAKPIPSEGERYTSSSQIHLWASPSPEHFVEEMQMDITLDRFSQQGSVMLVVYPPLRSSSEICIKTSRIWFRIRSKAMTRMS